MGRPKHGWGWEVLTPEVRRLLVLLAAIAVGSLGLAGGAAGSLSSSCEPIDGVITCTATDPGKGASGGGPSQGGQPACAYQGRAIPCMLGGAWWFGSHACYAMPAITSMVSAPGPAGEPGLWWACVVDLSGTAVFGGPIWFVPAAQSPAPDPGSVAKTALGSMRLERAHVMTAPAPPHPEIVGVEVWLWVPKAQWRTLTKTVTAGSTRVTATAVPSLVTWSMGDGSPPVTCGEAGRPWDTNYTDAEQTDCGYTYRTLSAGQPGGVFRISATISYFVTWTCAGACTSASGNLGLIAAPAGTGTIKSLQRQTVVVP